MLMQKSDLNIGKKAHCQFFQFSFNKLICILVKKKAEFKN